MITILTIISMLVIAAYTAAVCVKTKGVPYSISATYYYLEHKLYGMDCISVLYRHVLCWFSSQFQR